MINFVMCRKYIFKFSILRDISNRRVHKCICNMLYVVELNLTKCKIVYIVYYYCKSIKMFIVYGIKYLIVCCRSIYH